ncbi:MAG: putative oxidoreductase [Ilumatobacteraceae bacterium]|nr:putative oxidoreductase [Ilumatobacteraceae bacterium]
MSIQSSEHDTEHDTGPADLSALFTPLDLGSMHLRNRFAMAPMTRQQSPGGVPNAENAEHYRLRAAGGVGLIVTEGTYVRGPAAGPSSSVPRIYGDESAAGWQRVVAGVHAEGAAMIAQLWHLGVERGATPEFEPDVPTVSPSGVKFDGTPVGVALDDDGLRAVIDSFVESARVARQAGFDGVELHGAHGYLLDQFMWNLTNRRTDDFGGSIERRSAFPAAVVAAVRAAVGPDYPIVYRYSQWKGSQYTAQLAGVPSELEQVLAPLVDAGVSAFHVSTRRHWVPGFEEVDDSIGLAGWTRRLTGLPVITVGSVGVDTVFRSEAETVEYTTAQRLQLLAEQFGDEQFDVVALGRALLADPAWVDKVRTGRQADIVPFSQPAR